MRMKKRIISCILVAAMLLTLIPIPAAAKTSGNLYGDANGDGVIDLKDLLTISRYLGGQAEQMNYSCADVNGDGVVDKKDVQVLKKYLAEWDVTLGPDLVTVSFYDGERLIDVLTAEKNAPLQEVPSVAKSSKEDAVLLGYYLDPEFTQPFYADEAVTGNLTVYAKYQELDNSGTLNVTSFAQMDMPEDLSFEIVRTSGEVVPEEAAALEVKDGSDPVAVTVADEDGDGVYTVSAPEGFNKGCSYELTLADGWVFKDKEETIRTAAFSIAMDEVQNLQMSGDITYLADTDEMDYVMDGETYAVLSEDNLTEDGGTFVTEDAGEMEDGDILCIYTGIKPTERNAESAKELLDPAVYVKVTGINGEEVSFAPLGREEQAKLYDIPDNFPLQVESLPEGEEGTVNISALDEELYQEMYGEDGNYEAALEKISSGDFLTLYTSEEAISSEEDVYYARATDYDAETGEITYQKSSKQEIVDSMDLYTDIHVSGDDLVSDEEVEVLEQQLQSQVEESGFADEAAAFLSGVAEQTDAGIQVLNLGGNFELSDDVKLKVELINKGEQLHFGDGIQLAVKADATFEAETEEGKTAIDVSATFVEEVAVHPAVRGSIVTKKILGFIPVPIGVEVNASVDIKNYTAFSFNAEIYSVEADEEDIWEQIKAILNDPSELLGLENLPDGLAKGLSTASDVMDKINELQTKIEKAEDTAETIQGYKEDIDALWQVMENNDLTTREEWKEMGEALEKTNAASDLLDMMNLSDTYTDTEISPEYRQSMQDLMNKYSEIVQKETEWMKLVDKEIYSTEYRYYGLAIGIETSFIVRSDLSLAIGSNLQYEVGKRYNFWFRIGLFSPTAGNSSMDLMDEQFHFQFYVMGRLGVKAGVEAKLYVGLGTGKFASVGITAELGPYAKIYGFFVYEYDRYRAANSGQQTSKERMAGALYLDFGLYFMLGFEANALGNLFEYSYNFLDKEIPLLTAGAQKYYFEPAYQPEEDEKVILRDDDEDSTNGITATLADELRALRYLDLKTGIIGSEPLDYSAYQMTLSNPNFTLNKDNGTITVNVPEGTRYMECDLTITYLYSKLAFSKYDMTVTIPLVWTSLSTDELKEYYTVSVRVGNDTDGYQTVWSQKVLKNQPYNLPTDEEIRDLIGWNDAKYIQGSGYGDIQTTDLTLIGNTVYDYQVGYKTYEVTVGNIQNEDGSLTSQTFYAKYGETFDFSSLEETGTAANQVYTKFAGVESETGFDFTQSINGKMAEALLSGIIAEAVYVDNSAKVTFSFTGLDHEDIVQIAQKGTYPDFSEAEEIVSYNGLSIKDISPAMSKLTGPVVYQIVCGQIIGPDAAVKFHENGGSEVADIVKVEGSLIGVLPVSQRDGYTFAGWYLDDGTFENEFAERKMPVGGAEVYAKWIPKEYEVSFHVNGGNELGEGETAKTVTYDGVYGTLPQPERTGYAFVGWYTAQENGSQVTEETPVKITENQTLYAHWRKLVDIDKSVFDFGEIEEETYEKGVTHSPVYTFDAGDAAVSEDEFTMKYMRQGNTDYEEGFPVNAGVYNVTISRPADNVYAKFEQTYEAVLKIDKAVRNIEAGEIVDSGYTYLKTNAGDIYDLSDKAVLTLTVTGYNGLQDAGLCTNNMKRDRIDYLTPGITYDVYISITDDPNYEDVARTLYIPSASTTAAPTESWNGHADTSWYNDVDTEFTITTPEQLAGVSVLGGNFAGKTILLGADIDMTGYLWEPIDNFAGTFDGQNHTVRGMVCINSDDYKGLFGYISSDTEAIIANVRVEDSIFEYATYIGGIAGRIRSGSITNCVSAVVAVGTTYTGGIAGRSDGATISKCISYGKILDQYRANTKFENYIGGIVGYISTSKVTNCANFATIYTYPKNSSWLLFRHTFGGGIVGVSNYKDEIYNCYNAGRIIARKNGLCGAILGAASGNVHDNDRVAVEQCYFLKDTIFTNNAIYAESSITTIKSQKTAWFTSPASEMSSVCEDGTAGMNLVNTLNTWSKRVDGTDVWEVTEGNAYPTIIGMP